MADIQHLALPVMMVVILFGSIMLAPVDAIQRPQTARRRTDGRTQTAGRPSSTAASPRPIKDYIARVVYKSLTTKYVYEGKPTADIDPITINQVRQKKNKKGQGYDYSNNGLLIALSGHSNSITFEALRDKIASENYGLMEAALRLCVYEDMWRKNELEILLGLPADKTTQLANKTQS
ncbi:uncharacterized protein LOC111055095 isoform X1 [Nilaparvata lugens]|uniref:uncharacterized protein LOC111055095 isoform X1 n=1 Tax=Nilaparvata lugens TaxID=108931 RepID=UPI00193D11BD|nr:uncharacterized protein LOC111055095 isoform X1 [Nilaparvata lugens]